MDDLTTQIRNMLKAEIENEKKFILETAKWIADQAKTFEKKANKIIDDVIKTCEIVPKETIIDILQNHGSVFVKEIDVHHDGMHLDLSIDGLNILTDRPEFNKGRYSFIVIVKKLQDKEEVI